MGCENGERGEVHRPDGRDKVVRVVESAFDEGEKQESEEVVNGVAVGHGQE